MKFFFPGILSYFVSILAKSSIISFQYNIESVYFFYSNPVYSEILKESLEKAYVNTVAHQSCPQWANLRQLT
jgi:hypothetical protein